MTRREPRVTSHVLSRLVGILVITGLLLGPPVHAAVIFKHGVLTITQGGARAFLNVEVADSPESRAQGLGNRTSLASDAGMLFVFETTNLWSFWMKDTLIPLTVAFINEQWEIVDLIDMAVETNPQKPSMIYKAAKPALYALEVNQGYLRQKNITVGAKVGYTPR